MDSRRAGLSLISLTSPWLHESGCSVTKSKVFNIPVTSCKTSNSLYLGKTRKFSSSSLVISFMTGGCPSCQRTGRPEPG